MKYDSMSVQEMESEIKALEKALQEKNEALARELCLYQKGQDVFYHGATYRVVGIDYFTEGHWTAWFSKIIQTKKKTRISENPIPVRDFSIPIGRDWHDRLNGTIA